MITVSFLQEEAFIPGREEKFLRSLRCMSGEIGIGINWSFKILTSVFVRSTNSNFPPLWLCTNC